MVCAFTEGSSYANSVFIGVCQGPVYGCGGEDVFPVVVSLTRGKTAQINAASRQGLARGRASVHGLESVISANNRKNARLRSEEMPQLTGTLW